MPVGLSGGIGCRGSAAAAGLVELPEPVPGPGPPPVPAVPAPGAPVPAAPLPGAPPVPAPPVPGLAAKAASGMDSAQTSARHFTTLLCFIVVSLLITFHWKG